MPILGELSFFLGLWISQSKEEIFISQNKYIGDLLSKFGMLDSNSVSTPMEQNLKLTSHEGSALKIQQSIGNLLEA